MGHGDGEQSELGRSCVYCHEPRGSTLRVILTAGIALAAYRPAFAESEELLAWWRFDEVKNKTVIDAASRMADSLSGNYRLAKGVSGQGLKCDDFTTCATRSAGKAPQLGDAFTIQAWVAPQAYPWGWCPIVAQREGRARGYSGRGRGAGAAGRGRGRATAMGAGGV